MRKSTVSYMVLDTGWPNLLEALGGSGGSLPKFRLAMVVKVLSHDGFESDDPPPHALLCRIDEIEPFFGDPDSTKQEGY